MKRLAVLASLALGACASLPPPQEPATEPQSRAEPPRQPPARGGYYKDDGPGENPPANLAEVPDAQPRREALIAAANRPYAVFGRSYAPLGKVQPFQQTGMASWYGRRFHGQKTSSGEPYDMYAMTAAHPTLPIPSYARVTNLANGRSVVVRINDRGPFHSDRIIDLSYTAAYKLGYASAGSARVQVESIIPEDVQTAGAPAPEAVYLQVGAFSSRANAEDLRARIAARLSSVAQSIQVLSIGNLWRLHVGPYSREAAKAVGEQIEAELNLRPLLVVR
ncbi:MAG TPA: septal ring lytic transglycosylase RlpA family protein [Burkholderiales bacterium]|jgi:rare lipoprotein A|nr:septal ring lytic transglycosylase RlpA family protein [Burkholderiales bacterium]